MYKAGRSLDKSARLLDEYDGKYGGADTR